MTEHVVQTIKKSEHAVEKSAQVIDDVVEVAREEGVDWRTLREALALAGTAALRFVQWWLCGRGFHAWQAFEYDDGTVLDECVVCGAEREPEELLTRVGVGGPSLAARATPQPSSSWPSDDG